MTYASSIASSDSARSSHSSAASIRDNIVSSNSSSSNTTTTTNNNNTTTNNTTTTTGSMALKIMNFGQKVRPTVNVSFKDCDDCWVPTYSTLDRIEGKVSITCPVNTSFNALQIDFVGSTKTFVERLSSATAVSGRTEAFHQFLKLSQPIGEAAWPAGNLLEAGKTYDFPFLFVVPQQLLPRACRHNVVSDNVHQEHLQLPPSLGDRQVAGRGGHLLDDFAPDMARIRYAVVVTLQEKSWDGHAISPICTAKKVRIVPATEEKAPLSADGPESDYVLRQEKDLRKGVFKGKLGRLVIEAAQPKSIRLPSCTSDEETPASTVVNVNLRFDPANENARPPKLNSLHTKFKVSTFFSGSARVGLPSKASIQYDMNQGVHSETFSLAHRCVANVDWTEHEASPCQSRRSSWHSSDSDSGFGSETEASAKYKGKAYYTASILVPVSLPTNKAWIPTFHTCLISRVYAIHLCLTTAGSAISASTNLKVPVQVSSEGNAARLAEHRATVEELERQAVEAMDADDFFAPRTISPISPAYTGRSTLITASAEPDLPPGYDDFPRAGNRQPISV